MFLFDSLLERHTHLINCFQKQFHSALMHPSLHYSSYYSEVLMASVGALLVCISRKTREARLALSESLCLRLRLQLG